MADLNHKSRRFFDETTREFGAGKWRQKNCICV